MRKTPAALVAACALSLFTAVRAAEGPPERSEEQMYRSFAVSRCLALATPESDVGRDAVRSAAGYLELGRLPIEAYEAASALAEAQLKVPYNAQDGGSLDVMRCVDLYDSDAMGKLVREHVPRRWRRRR